MKKTIKRRILPLALLVMLLSCILMLAGCGDSVDNIAISDSAKPRTVFVQGQELDLSAGTLTVISDGETTSVPMNDPAITVSGYNKDQLGKQTVTLTYKGATVTLEVTVVARVTVNDYEMNYFVGESFDNSKGKVKVAKDDGTFTTVDLNSSDVTVSGFDSSKAGTLQVNVSYTGGGANHQGSFQVKIHNVGELSFTKPSKMAYKSHETELVLTGGYFEVTSADDASVKKLVSITEDMVSGFDPNAATPENKSEPLRQTLTVAYAGQTFQFEISIVYGAISLIQENAKLLQDLDWTQEVTLTAQQGAAAVEAMAEYLNLTRFDKELVDEATLKTIVLPAAQYLSQLFLQEAENYSQTFTINKDGNFNFVGKTYEDMAIHKAKLADANEAFNVYAAMLRQMKETFKDMEIREDETIGDYIKVPPEEEVNFYINIFNFLMDLHDNMSLIPEDWKVEDLEPYAENINMAVYMIQVYGLIGPDYSYVFEALANWRTNNDYFEIIYSYFCYVAEDGHDFIRENVWQILPMPGDMQDWYLAFYRAVVEAKYMSTNGDGDAYLRDTSNFMYYYFEALRLAEEIKNGDNQLYKDIYDVIHGDQYMQENIMGVAGGFVEHSNGLLDSEVYNRLWNQIITVYHLYVDKQFDAKIHGAEVEAIFAAMTVMNAVELFEFLCSLQYNYIETQGTYHAFDYSKSVGNNLVYFLVNYYLAELPESAHPIFQDLLLAMENYAIYQGNGRTSAKSLEEFKKGMEELHLAIGNLSDADRAKVESLLGACYNKYYAIYEVMDVLEEFTLDANQQLQVDGLRDALDLYGQISAYMSEPGISSNELRFTSIQMFAAYEKAKALYEALMASGNADVITLLNTKLYQINGAEQTLDMAFNIARNGFVYWLYFGLRFDVKDDAGTVIGSMPAWDLYHTTGVDQFVREAADLLLAGFTDTVEKLDAAYVARVGGHLQTLNADACFLLYGIGVQRYLDCMAAYYRATLTDVNDQNMAIAILDVQFGYVVYHALGNRQQEITYFNEQFEAAKALYESLADTTVFDQQLKAMYEFYKAFYESLQ